MAKRITLVAGLALILAAGAAEISADMRCRPAVVVRSPITGEVVDCIEDGGDNCIACTVEDKGL